MNDAEPSPTPTLPVKGETTCNRTACQAGIVGNRWWNVSTCAWYCQSCAMRINAASAEFHEPFLCFREGYVPTVLPPGFHGPRKVAP